jgi:hypothetical protein
LTRVEMEEGAVSGARARKNVTGDLAVDPETVWRVEKIRPTRVL